MNFCRRCGATLNNGAEGSYICKNEHRLYANPAPTVGVFFITDDHQVLLSVRALEPFKGTLDTFGGFIDDQETAEHALERELQEELGLTSDQYEEPVFLSTETGLYPYSGEDRSVLSVFYWSKLRRDANPVAKDDVADIATIPLADIDLNRIGNVDVQTAIQKLQRAIL